MLGHSVSPSEKDLQRLREHWRLNEIPEPFLKRLPQKPGVYQMLDVAGTVLYVGKARNLKSRVTSYFRASGLSTKTMALVARDFGRHAAGDALSGTGGPPWRPRK